MRAHFDRLWDWLILCGWVAFILYALWQVFR
jgi:hypothetical protein